MYTDTHAKELALLNYIEHNAHATQRELSEQVGMSLGAINLLLKTLIKKGFVKVEKLTPNSVKYFLTPAGIADKLDRTYSYIVRTYREIDHMRNRIVTVTNNLASLHQADKILFYGPKDDFSLMVTDLVNIESFDIPVTVCHSMERVKGESGEFKAEDEKVQHGDGKTGISKIEDRKNESRKNEIDQHQGRSKESAEIEESKIEFLRNEKVKIEEQKIQSDKIEYIKNEISTPIIVWREDDERELKAIGLRSVNLLGMVSVLGPKEVAVYE
ncbi:winged helix-turn-helix transcriptional regulator [Pleomorphochaeta sp. DL1XJH-081]|uniref:winged helix-turn-helix transcriptional regulator n=1 Tax=Pleomorphochaeta sp. DL1XJH-081 TaxID=3409690 RepID=UPI003BB760BA